MNVTTCFAMPETVSAGSPSELATPALLNRMTGRSFARPSVTLGSQLSSPPRKCCKNTTGVPVLAPNRLYAYLTPLASRNCVGVVLCEFVISRLPVQWLAGKRALSDPASEFHERPQINLLCPC